MPRTKFIDMTGLRIGRLLVKEYIFRHKEEGRSTWLCICDCGNTKEYLRSSLHAGETFSCGCLRKSSTPRKAKKYGGIKAPEYKNWTSMKDRCLNKKSKGFSSYGKVGITVCDEWIISFERFMDDMGRKPSPRHTLDRIDNLKGYSKENCRWASKEEQANNRRNSLVFNIDGETSSLSQWGRELGIQQLPLRKLLERGPTRSQIDSWKEDKLANKNGACLSFGLEKTPSEEFCRENFEIRIRSLEKDLEICKSTISALATENLLLKRQTKLYWDELLERRISREFVN